MIRRNFLIQSALVSTYGFGRSAAAWGAYLGVRGGEMAADVVIVGAGVGGCAAALAVARAGKTAIVTEPTDWIGGQLTQQAVPPDEHPWIETFGANASYRDFRKAIREYYRAHYPLTKQALANPLLNPGNGGVSRLCCEPRSALAALTQRLAPHVTSGRVVVLHEHIPVKAEVAGDRVKAVTVRDLRTGAERTLTGKYVLDASELGDLLPLAGAEHVTGFESRKTTGEERAPETAQPLNQQAITCCFAMEYRPGENHVIDKPAEYAFWRDYEPRLTPEWPGKLLSLTGTDPISRGPRVYAFNPAGGGGDDEGLWKYRRIVDPANFTAGFLPGGVTLVNWPQNDYWLGPIAGSGVTETAANEHIQRAKRLSLSLLYWLQTEAPRADGGTGWPGLLLRPDIVGTTDGLAKHPYIRESRRIAAEFTVNENHVGVDARKKKPGGASRTAEKFADSVGVGSYRIDLHPSTGGDNYIDVASLRFQVPLGSLVPVRLENLVAACKNLGVTHITNGCFRLHPVEWSIGEAAGALAAFCIEKGESPRAVRADPRRLNEFQGRLRAQGVETGWPES